MLLLECIKNRKPLWSPADQYFNLVHLDIIADIIKIAIGQDIVEIYNLGSNEEISRYEFNKKNLRKFNIDEQYLEEIDSRLLVASILDNNTISPLLIPETQESKIPDISHMMEILYNSTWGHPIITG